MWSMRDTGREQGPPESQREVMDRFAAKVVEWRMSAPAILFLESVKPLSFLGNQALIFFQPIVQSLFNFRTYDEFIEILEDRQNLEYLLVRIEELEAEHVKTERQERRRRREERRAAKSGKEGADE
jgi:hypothetical protein